MRYVIVFCPGTQFSIAMPATAHGPGRPRFIADIDFVNDPDLPSWQEFRDVCLQFCEDSVINVTATLSNFKISTDAA